MILGGSGEGPIATLEAPDIRDAPSLDLKAVTRRTRRIPSESPSDYPTAARATNGATWRLAALTSLLPFDV